MGAMRRAAAPALRRAGLPLVACAVVLAGALGGCASDGGGGGDLLGGEDGGGAAGWPASVPRPDLPLVEETDLLIAYTATYELRGGSIGDYVAMLEADGFDEQGQSTWSDGEHVVLVEVELDRMYVTITDA